MRNAVKKDFRDIYSSPMSQGTRCHQLATYIVFDSPLVMLCDAPTAYRKEPECTRFIAGLPVVADETRILRGKWENISSQPGGWGKTGLSED